MADGGTIEAQSADDECGSHAGAGAPGERFRFAHARVGRLHELIDKILGENVFLGAAESADNLLHGSTRGHFTLALAADAIGKSENPPVRTRLRGRLRRDVANGILVLRTRQTGIGEFREFNFQHARCDGAGRAAGCGKDPDEHPSG